MPRIDHNHTDPEFNHYQHSDMTCVDNDSVCRCSNPIDLDNAYRCLYCKEWFCTLCAEEHFGRTVEEWKWSKLLLEPANKAQQTINKHMNILNESIQIRQRFHDFQRFTNKKEDISMNAFLTKEIKEWGDLCNETKNKIVTAYHYVISISSAELPVKKEYQSKFSRGDILIEKRSHNIFVVIQTPFKEHGEYTMRSFGGDNDSHIIKIEQRNVENGRFEIKPKADCRKVVTYKREHKYL